MNSLFIPILAHFINRDKIIKWDIIGILIAFFGMVLVVQPFKSGQEE